MHRLNKRGVVTSEEIMGIIGLVILFTGLGIFLKIAGLLEPSGQTVRAKLAEATASKVCDVDLVNLLRAKSDKGITFAEMFAITANEPDYADVLKESAVKFMGQNYRRGDNQKSRWKLTGKIPELETPFITFGTMERVSGLDTCSKLVPSENPGEPIAVELTAEDLELVSPLPEERDLHVTPIPCSDDEADLSLTNPQVIYQDSSAADVKNFDPSRRFRALMDFKSTNTACLGNAQIRLYGKAPWMPNEMDLGAQGVLWEPPMRQATPDSTLNYPGDFNFQPPRDWAIFPQNPSTNKWDKGTYTLKFSLTPLDFTDSDQNNNVYTIQLTVR